MGDSMNILLVDDDSYVLEALKKSLDWEDMGIKNVYTAQSVNKAKKIIRDVMIHLLVCDIEMPKENGFELLKWLKEKNYIIKDILLTSYAEFKYATEAIKYNCYAYALKPIDYKELEKLITGAIEEEKKAMSLINHEKYLEYWTASQKIRNEQFFSEMLLNRQQGNVWKYGADYKADQLFLPVMVTYFTNGEDAGSGYGKGMFEWTLKNLMMEMFTGEGYSAEAVLPVKDGFYLALVQLDRTVNGCKFMETAAAGFLKKADKRLEVPCSVIIGITAQFKYLQSGVSAFISFLKKALVEPDTVMTLTDYKIVQASYTVPDFMLWESFLKGRQEEAIKAEVDKYLDSQILFHNPDKEILKKFIVNFTQLLIAILKDKEITAYHMGNFLFDPELIEYSSQSITNAKKGIRRMIDVVMDRLKEEEEDKSTVRTVKAYINNNLDKEISREALAELVYLNQDYLARIFKKETGESVGCYITRKRVERAKEYLRKTKESVNTIALSVGYDNFSYFTKVFKSSVGMTPKEFRREERKEQ